FPHLLNTRYIFSFLMVLGVFFLKPFIEQFRKFRGDDSIRILPNSWNFIKSGEFDSFQNFMTALHMNTVTYGEQLLAVVFFFVPRSIWPDKPIGSGAQIAKDANLSWSNISMNF